MADDIADVTETAEPGKCHLLALPAELRNEIWKLVLPEERQFCPCQKAPKSKYHCEHHEIYRLPVILRVSRQIQIEVGALWYPSLQMDFKYSDDLDTWLFMLSAEKASLLRCLRYDWPHGGLEWHKAETYAIASLRLNKSVNRSPAINAYMFNISLQLEDGTRVAITTQAPRSDAAKHGVDVAKVPLLSDYYWLHGLAEPSE